MRFEDVWPEWHECDLIGEGSFGKVYKAKREEFGESFYSAIKVLSVPKSSQDIRQERAQGMSDVEIHAYFQSVVQDLVNEIVLMENLKGASNIVSIDDYRIIERTDEIGWDIFIRMELLSPFDKIVNSPDFSPVDVLRMGADICSALEICEYNNIVHRDIKPDNIFVSKYGEYKLGDFGISRQLDKTQANMSRKGTLNFMAPEVYKGEAYGSSVDTYSLGLVMYKLLNKNRLPFIDSDKQNLKYNERQEAFERRIRGEKLPLIPGIGNSLNYILQKACAFNPNDRYYSASEFKNDILEELNNILNYGYPDATISSAPYYDNRQNPLESTTNDMTSQGTVMYDAGSMFEQSYSGSGESPYGNYYADNAAKKRRKNLPKTNKACRFWAIPLALITTAVLLFGVYENSRLIPFIAIGVMIMLVSKNRFAMGCSVVAVGASLAIELITYVQTVVGLILGICVSAMYLFGGLSMILQKEVRLGATLCLYGGIAYAIYNLINDSYAGIYCWLPILFGLAILLWAYGYDSKFVVQKTKDKIIYYSSYGIAAIGIVAGAVAVI